MLGIKEMETKGTAFGNRRKQTVSTKCESNPGRLQIG